LPREEGNITSKVDNKSKNGDKGFKIGHLNIRSLLIKNIDQLKIYLSNHQYDIICINETWLDDKINTYGVSLDGYDLVRKDRKRTGGGVAMYWRQSRWK
jgi:exonuclease III